MISSDFFYTLLVLLMRKGALCIHIYYMPRNKRIANNLQKINETIFLLGTVARCASDLWNTLSINIRMCV